MNSRCVHLRQTCELYLYLYLYLYLSAVSFIPWHGIHVCVHLRQTCELSSSKLSSPVSLLAGETARWAADSPSSKTHLENPPRKLTSKRSLKAIRPCHFPPSPSRVSFPSRGRVWLASAASNGSVLFPTPGSSLHELIYLERGRWTSPWLSDQSSAGLQQSSPTSLSSESPLSLQRCCCRMKPSQVRTSPDLSALVNPSSQEFEPRSRSKSRPQRILYFAIKD